MRDREDYARMVEGHLRSAEQAWADGHGDLAMFLVGAAQALATLATVAPSPYVQHKHPGSTCRGTTDQSLVAGSREMDREKA